MMKFKLMVRINKYFKFILFVEGNKTLKFMFTLKSVEFYSIVFMG